MQRRPAGDLLEEITSSPAVTRTPTPKNERQSQAPGIPSRHVSIVPNTQIQGLVDEEQDQPSSSAAVDLEDYEEEMDD